MVHGFITSSLCRQYIRQAEGQTICGINVCKVFAERHYTLMWMLTGKQMNVFQFQQLFRAMSHHGCSLNDNKFMLALSGWHWRLALRPDILTMMPAFMSRQGKDMERIGCKLVYLWLE